MGLSIGISRNKDNTACAVFEVEGHKFYVPQISMSYVRPQRKTLGVKRPKFEMFCEANAELLDADTVKLIHPEWDGDLILRVKNDSRVVESFGSGVLYSTFREMVVKVFKSVSEGHYENW